MTPSAHPRGPGPRAYLLALLGQGLLAALFVHPWDGFVFQTTVDAFVTDGTTPYETIDERPPWIYNKADPITSGEWYAYPALPLLLMAIPYAFVHALGVPWVWAYRVAWKLPIIVATLLLPRLGRMTALALGAKPTKARRLESLLLWNPFLWVMGPLWGMTEPLMACFLFASLTAYARKRFALSGALWGLAASIKIFPWFIYPAFVLWIAIHHHRHWRPALVHAAAAGGTFLALALPFLLTTPNGFLELTLLMHLRRPPAGFSLLVPVYEGLRGFVSTDTALFVSTLVGLAGFTTFILLTLGWLTGSRRGHHDELPFALGGLLLGFVFLNKVVHWQYLLPPSLLFAVAASLPTPHPADLNRFCRRWFPAAAAALLLENFRFFLFIPFDVTQQLWGFNGEDYLDHVRRLFHAPPEIYAYISLPLVALLAAWSAWPLLRPLMHFFYDAAQGVGKAFRLLGAFHPSGRLPRPLLALLVVLLFALPSGVALYLHTGQPERAPEPLAPLGDHVLGGYYYLWWRNPSYDFQVRDGNWRYATTTPTVGYYSSFRPEIEGGIRDMKAAGFDFALVPLHAYDGRTPFETLARAAETEGFRFAPLLVLENRPRWDERTISTAPAPLQSLTEETIDDWRGVFDQIREDVYQSPNLLQLGENRPVLFVQGARYLGNPEDPDEVAWVLQRLLDTQPAADLTQAVGNQSWIERPDYLTPSHHAEAASPTALQAYWQEAYATRYREAWQEILEDVLQTLPEVRFVLADSDARAPGFPQDRVVATFTPWDEVRPGGVRPARSSSVAHFTTLYPAYDAHLLRPTDPRQPLGAPPEAFLTTNWAAHADESLLLIHSWNEHQEGTAIEPTLQASTTLLDTTRRLAAEWRAGDA